VISASAIARMRMTSCAGCRREDLDTLCHPEFEHTLEFRPQRAPILALEIKRIMSWYFLGGFSAYWMVPSVDA